MKKEHIYRTIHHYEKEWKKISRFLWENPELGNEEHLAVKALTEELDRHHFSIEYEAAGIETAFIARYRSKASGPVIGYFAEYDALPKIGHACGHNLIGVMSLGAAIALKGAVDTFGGEVIVFGSPAEETNGAKVTFAEKGYLDGVDVALMAHPSSRHERSGSSRAMEALQFDFYGKPSHAASNPENGINALDGVIQTFNGINALRQHVPDDVRIHGIISHGGDVVNVVPERAQAQFYVRAKEKPILEKTVTRVKQCGEAAALATGSQLKITNHELGYDNLVTNEALSNLYCQNLIELGVDPDDIESGHEHGSIDMGNVSHVVPAIHPYIKMENSPYAGHTVEFREAAGDERGFNAMILGAKTLAGVGFDLITTPSLLKEIKAEFNKNNVYS